MKGRSHQTLEMPSKTRRSILLVDADPCILALVKAMLEGQGYRVLLANNTESAMRIVAQNRLRIDFLMTNVSDRRAPDLAARVLEVRPGIEMLFMSTTRDPQALRLRMIDDGTGPRRLQAAEAAASRPTVATLGHA
jgi:DNA-binding NtrC family response regulator